MRNSFYGILSTESDVHEINGIVRSLLLFYSCSMHVKQSSWFFTWFLRWKCVIIDFQTFILWVKWLRKEQMPFLHKIGDYGRTNYIMKRLLLLNFTHNWCLSITIYEHSIKCIGKSFNFEDNAKCWQWIKTIPFRNVQLCWISIQLCWMDQWVDIVWQFDDNLKQLTMHQPPISEQWMYSYKIRLHSVNWHSHLAFAC